MVRDASLIAMLLTMRSRIASPPMPLAIILRRDENPRPEQRASGAAHF